MTIAELFDKFIMAKRLRGLAKKSIDDYVMFISMFVRFVGGEKTLEQLSKDDVDGFILHYLESGLSKNTITTYIRNAKIFLCWVHSNYGLGFDPHLIEKPRAPKKLVQIYTNDEILRIFDAVHASVPWLTVRNKAIVSLMYDSGIRQGEVCGLLRKNLDFQRMIFKVCGKGAKERYVPLGEASKAFLLEYFKLCPYTSDYVFVNRGGRPLTNNAVRLFVNRLKQQTGIDVSSHKLRHNFATNFCLDNIKRTGCSNIHDLSIIMGHESVETTKRYEHFAHELVAVHQHFSHLDAIFA